METYNKYFQNIIQFKEDSLGLTKYILYFIKNNTIMTFKEIYKLYDMFRDYSQGMYLYEPEFISILKSFKYPLANDTIIKKAFECFCVLYGSKMCLLEFLYGLSILMSKCNLIKIEELFFDLIKINDEVTKDSLLNLSKTYYIKIDEYNISLYRLCKWILLHNDMKVDFHVYKDIINIDIIRDTIRLIFLLKI